MIWGTSAFGKWLKKNGKSLLLDKLHSYLVGLSLGNCKKVTLVPQIINSVWFQFEDIAS